MDLTWHTIYKDDLPPPYIDIPKTVPISTTFRKSTNKDGWVKRIKNRRKNKNKTDNQKVKTYENKVELTGELCNDRPKTKDINYSSDSSDDILIINIDP